MLGGGWVAARGELVEPWAAGGAGVARRGRWGTGVVHDDARAAGGGACPLSLWERVRVRETGSSGGWILRSRRMTRGARMLRGVGGGGRGVEEGKL